MSKTDDDRSVKQFKDALRREGGRHRAAEPAHDSRQRRDKAGLRRPGPKHEGGIFDTPDFATDRRGSSSVIGQRRKPVGGTPDRTPRKPRSAVTTRTTRPRRTGGGAGLGAAANEATEYARRATIRATGTKPSVTGRAASGAAAGAATGAALGNLPGAAAGAVVGGSAGALSGHKAKKAYRQAVRAESGTSRRLLLGEFTVCLTVAALSPLTDAKRSEGPGDWMKRMTAILGLFFILALVSAAGRGSAKVAAGLGGLVTVVLLVSERDLFVKLAQIFTSSSGPQTNSESVGVTEQRFGGG